MADQSTALQVRAKTLNTMLEKYKPQIARALPKSFDPDQFVRIAFTATQKNPKLYECEPKSFLRSVIQSAQLGLDIDDGRGLAFIVPFWNSRAKRLDAQFIPGYKGLIELAYRSPKVIDVNVGLVYDKEEAEAMASYKKGECHISGRPSERGTEMVAAYTIVRLVGGGIVKMWMWDEEILEIREKSSSYQAYKAKKIYSCIWVDDPKWMWIKCPIRQIAKLIPSATELQRVVELEEKSEAIGAPVKEFFFDDEDVQEHADYELTEDARTGTESKTEDLKAKLGNLKKDEKKDTPVGSTPTDAGAKEGGKLV